MFGAGEFSATISYFEIPEVANLILFSGNVYHLQFQFLGFLPQGQSGLLGFSLWSRPALAFVPSPNPAGRSHGCTLQGLRTKVGVISHQMFYKVQRNQ